MKDFFGPLMLVVLLAVCCFVAGWAAASRGGRAALDKAQQDAAVCADQLRSKASAMDQVRGQLNDLRTRHETALAQATAALDGRDAQLQALRDARDRKLESIRKIANENVAVAALDRLAVPPALAHQLWPVAGAEPGAATH